LYSPPTVIENPEGVSIDAEPCGTDELTNKLKPISKIMLIFEY
jgi:hypothetical protein